jgi:hypothetical protein
MKLPSLQLLGRAGGDSPPLFAPKHDPPAIQESSHDLGFTRHRGVHLLQMAIESLEDIGRIYLMGSMRVEEMGVALWGDLTTMRDSSSLG